MSGAYAMFPGRFVFVFRIFDCAADLDFGLVVDQHAAGDQFVSRNQFRPIGSIRGRVRYSFPFEETRVAPFERAVREDVRGDRDETIMTGTRGRSFVDVAG